MLMNYEPTLLHVPNTNMYNISGRAVDSNLHRVHNVEEHMHLACITCVIWCHF